MSSFILKIIALIAMIIDHIACVFGWGGWNLLPFNTDIMRYVGRISFPIFAFCIVNGWKHTRNKKRYFCNLCLGAIVSQIPFSLSFYTPNQMNISSEYAFSYRINPIWILIGVLCAVTYWYFVLNKRKDKSVLIVWAATTLPFLFVKINYMWVLSGSLNVLYTLAIGVFALYFIESIRSKRYNWWENVWLAIALTLVAVAFSSLADYGIYMMGLALIIALYTTQKWKWLQSLTIVAWGCIYYGLVIGNWNNAIATVVPAILVLLYNHSSGKKSKFGKLLFYIAYPAHLLIIGVINVVLRVG